MIFSLLGMDSPCSLRLYAGNTVRAQTSTTAFDGNSNEIEPFPDQTSRESGLVNVFGVNEEAELISTQSACRHSSRLVMILAHNKGISLEEVL